MIRNSLGRAIVRAFDNAKRDDKKLRNIKILFPMVENGKQAEKIVSFVRSLEKELGIEGGIKIGGMIETTTAVKNRLDIISALDFVSVGTNDLVASITGSLGRRTGALDVSTVLSLEFIRAASLIHRTAAEMGKPLSFCGEWAGYVKTILVL